MTIFFILFTALLAFFLQRRAIKKGLEAVEGDHRPDRLLAEPDETFHLRISLQNRSRRFISFLKVRERFPAAFQPQVDEDSISVDPHGVSYVEFSTWLRPRQQATYEIPISIASRGRYILSEFSLYCGDFLGITEREKYCGRFKEIVVPPKELPSVRLSEVFGGFMGEVSVTRFILEDPVLTLGFREYTGREPMKSISWAQSARANRLMVRKNDYTLEPSVAVILNVATALPNRAEALEQTFSLARTVCSMLEKRGIKYSFSSNATFPGGSDALTSATEGLGTRHFSGILERLGRASYEPSVSLSRLLEREAFRQTSAGRILITPGDPIPPKTLHKLREASNGNLLILNASEVATW